MNRCKNALISYRSLTMALVALGTFLIVSILAGDNEATANQPPPPPEEYTLTVNKQGGDSTCEVRIDLPGPSAWTTGSVQDTFDWGTEYVPGHRITCPSDYKFVGWDSEEDSELDSWDETSNPDFHLTEDTTATAVFELKAAVENFRCHESEFNEPETPCESAPAGNIVTEYRFDSTTGNIGELYGNILEVLCYDTSASFSQDVLPWLQSRDPQDTDGPDFPGASSVIQEPWYSKYLGQFNGTYPKWVIWANSSIQSLPTVDTDTAYFRDINGVALTPLETHTSGEYTLKQFVIWDRGCGAFELLDTFNIKRKSYGTGKKISITKTPGCPGSEHVIECAEGWSE